MVCIYRTLALLFASYLKLYPQLRRLIVIRSARVHSAVYSQHFVIESGSVSRITK